MSNQVIADQLVRWRQDARIFVRECLHAEPDPWQDEVLAAYSGITTDKNRIALKACKGPGKTTTESWCGLHFLSLFPYSNTAATSITGDNLRDGLWKELRKWMRRSKWIEHQFVWTKERIFHRDNPEDWFISARKWSKDADPEQQANSLAGLHQDFIMFIIDEAGGVPDSVAAAAEGGLATGQRCILLIGGNPTHAAGPLYRACTSERDLWWIKEITGDPDDPNRAPRVDIGWAREQIKKYGRKSPYVMVNVLGQFPKGATDSVLAIGWIEDAINRYGMPMEKEEPRILGVDVARFGSDLTVVCFRVGDAIHEFRDWSGKNTQETAKLVRKIFNELECDQIRVDDVGVGGGVTDRLKEMGLPVVGINVGESPIDGQDEHINLRSELYHDLQERFATGIIQLNPVIREHTSFIAEGTTLKIEFNDRNKRRIEPKEKYRRRTGRSPNFLDAAVLAFADRAALMSCAASGGERKMVRGAYNPYTKSAGYKLSRRTRKRSRLFDRRS